MRTRTQGCCKGSLPPLFFFFWVQFHKALPYLPLSVLTVHTGLYGPCLPILCDPFHYLYICRRNRISHLALFCTECRGRVFVQNTDNHLQKRDVFSPKCLEWLWGPPIFLSKAYWGSYPGVKWLGCDIHRSLPYTTEVKDK